MLQLDACAMSLASRRSRYNHLLKELQAGRDRRPGTTVVPPAIDPLDSARQFKIPHSWRWSSVAHGVERRRTVPQARLYTPESAGQGSCGRVAAACPCSAHFSGVDSARAASCAAVVPRRDSRVGHVDDGVDRSRDLKASFPSHLAASRVSCPRLPFTSRPRTPSCTPFRELLGLFATHQSLDLVLLPLWSSEKGLGRLLAWGSRRLVLGHTPGTVLRAYPGVPLAHQSSWAVDGGNGGRRSVGGRMLYIDVHVVAETRQGCRRTT